MLERLPTSLATVPGQWQHRRLALMLVVTVGLFVGVIVPYSAAVADPQPLPPVSGNDSLDAYVAVAGSDRLIVRDPQEQVVFRSRAYDNMLDIDPLSEARPFTVLFVATERLTGGEADCGRSTCVRQVIGRANVTTGETTTLYTTVDPGYDNQQWHDIDRFNETHLAVADMPRDRMVLLDVESGTQTVVWNASQRYDHSDGGPFPHDWTHMNDIEVLPDGRLMASVRNLDSVAFVDPGTGQFESNWTLGSENDHGTLYEQHNPDFLANGSDLPAVLVADSENNRIVEYQRTAAGNWRRSWTWQDPYLSWPRDADRLPDGRTLVTDTTGNRVLLVGTGGEVQWEWRITGAYEAEILAIGDESGHTPTAASADLAPRIQPLPSTGPLAQPHDWLRSQAERLLPAKWVHGLLFVVPWWLRFGHALVLLVGFVAMLWLGVGEVRWQRRRRD